MAPTIGFCHLKTESCFGPLGGLGTLARRLAGPHPEGSYTARLLSDRTLLDSKLREEARELAEAETVAEVTHEAADVMYFALVRALSAGVSLADIEAELGRRSRRVRRRGGESKGE